MSNYNRLSVVAYRLLCTRKHAGYASIVPQTGLSVHYDDAQRSDAFVNTYVVHMQNLCMDARSTGASLRFQLLSTGEVSTLSIYAMQT